MICLMIHGIDKVNLEKHGGMLREVATVHVMRTKGGKKAEESQERETD